MNIQKRSETDQVTKIAGELRLAEVTEYRKILGKGQKSIKMIEYTQSYQKSWQSLK